MSNGETKKCSHVFEWIVMIFLLLVVGGLIAGWIWLKKSGRASGCLGGMGSWTDSGRTLVENVLIQTAYNQKSKNPPSADCMACLVEMGQGEMEPQDYIVEILKGKKSTIFPENVKKCNCSAFPEVT